MAQDAFKGIANLVMGIVVLIFALIIGTVMTFTFFNSVEDMDALNDTEIITDLETTFEDNIALIVAFVGIVILVSFFALLMPMMSNASKKL